MSKKATSLVVGESADIIHRNSFEGTYQYSNKCNHQLQVTIGCGDDFGDDDPDVCLFFRIFFRNVTGDSGTGLRNLIIRGREIIKFPTLTEQSIPIVYVCVFLNISSLIGDDGGRGWWTQIIQTQGHPFSLLKRM